MSREIDADILRMDGEGMVGEIMTLRQQVAALREQVAELEAIRNFCVRSLDGRVEGLREAEKFCQLYSTVGRVRQEIQAEIAVLERKHE